jgi:uncharacterized protein YggU (UPF0235/DUF167 family)
VLEAPVDDDIWTARLKSPPVDGKANAELIGLVADYFDCAKSRVTLRKGAGARIKQIIIDDGN